MHRFRVLFTVSATLALAAPAASGQVACGATVTSNAVMTADLVCPGHDPAFTIKGPATVDMRGHQVSGCPENGTAIAIVGAKGGLKNGAVIGCHRGVHVAGSGGHTVENVAVYNGTDHGFQIDSAGNLVERAATFATDGYRVTADDNTLRRNVAVATSWGFRANGRGGRYIANVAVHVSNDGFSVIGTDNLLTGNRVHDAYVGYWVEGGQNRIADNVASACEDDGFFIYDQHVRAGSRVERNIAVANLEQGIDVVRGAYVFGNLAAGNELDGFHNHEGGNRFRRNTAAANGNAGIRVNGGGTLVDKNLALANFGGIAIETAATGISIVDNVAVGSSQDDLSDESAQCTGHTWSNNVFATGDPACTD